MKCFRLFIVSFLIIGYSFLCVCLCNISNGNVEKYSIHNDNLKISKNEAEISEDSSFNVLGNIKIPKINLENTLYPIGSPLNTVDKNIEVLSSSNMPDEDGGNFILAAHNGYSPIAYFHNLNKLSIGDEVFVSYNGVDYRYVVNDIYDVIKTGKVEIKRDKNRRTITMITFKGEDKQLVVIGYLK